MMRERGGRPLLLIDIAVPRDVDPACAELDGVSLYDIDDLQAVVARNLSSREERAAARAGDRRGGDPPLRALARPARRAADGERAARARQHDRRAGARRERGTLGVGLAARPGAHRGDRARGHEPPAARADDPPAQPRARSAATRAWSSCASCSACARSEAAPSRQPPSELAEVHDLARPCRPSGACRRGTPAPRGLMRLGTRRSALALAQAELVAKLLERASASGRARPDRHPRRPRVRGRDDTAGLAAMAPASRRRRGQVALGLRARARAAGRGEIDLAVHSAKDVPGELARGPGARLGARPARGARGRAVRRARPGRARAGRARRARAASAAWPSCARRARTSRWWRCAATSTRACASSRMRTRAWTRSCSRARGCSGSGARTRRAACSTRRASCPAPGQGTLALEAREDDAAARAQSLSAIGDVDALICLLAERALARALGASCDTPLGAHADDRGRPDAPARLGRAARRLGVDRGRAERRCRRAHRQLAARGRADGCAHRGRRELLRRAAS